MWLLTTTAINSRQEIVENTLKIRSNSWEALFDGRLFRWDVLESLMEKGSLLSVAIHFYPSGRKRIKKGEDGLFYLYVEDILVSKGYEVREEAWNSR